MAIFIFLVGIFNMRACVLKKSGMVAMPMTPPHTWGSYDPPTLGVPMTPHTWGSYDPPHTWGSYDPPTLGVPGVRMVTSSGRDNVARLCLK
jgi:hypothetical protein